MRESARIRTCTQWHSHCVRFKSFDQNRTTENFQLSQEKGHVSISLVANLYQQASTCRDEDRLADIGHRKQAQNPYKEKYGDDHWEKKIRESAAMRPFRCITELIKHVIAEGKIKSSKAQRTKTTGSSTMTRSA
jgi:hypothetical protein